MKAKYIFLKNMWGIHCSFSKTIRICRTVPRIGGLSESSMNSVFDILCRLKYSWSYQKAVERLYLQYKSSREKLAVCFWRPLANGLIYQELAPQAWWELSATQKVLYTSISQALRQAVLFLLTTENHLMCVHKLKGKNPRNVRMHIIMVYLVFSKRMNSI